LYFEDIAESCRKILRYTLGFDFEAFKKDERTYDAVVRNLEVIGEAAKQIPKKVRAEHPDIDWRRIAGMRDVLAHGYFSLEAAIIWDIVQTKVSPLLGAVTVILTARP